MQKSDWDSQGDTLPSPNLMERNDEEDDVEDPLPAVEESRPFDDEPRPEDEEKVEGKRTASSSKPVAMMGRSATMSEMAITTQRCDGMTITPAPCLLSPLESPRVLSSSVPVAAPPPGTHPLLRRRRQQ